MMEMLILLAATIPAVLHIATGLRARSEARRPFVPLTPAQDAALAAALRRGLAR